MKCAQTQNQIIHVSSYHVGRGHLDGGELGDEEVDHADVGVGDVAALPLGPGGRVVLEGVLVGADQVLKLVTLHCKINTYPRQIEPKQLFEVILDQGVMGRVKVIEDGSKVFSNVVVMLLADSDGRVLELGGRVVERLDAVVSGLLER